MTRREAILLYAKLHVAPVMQAGIHLEKSNNFDYGLAALRSSAGRALSASERVLRLANLERGDMLVALTFAVTTGVISLVVPVTVQTLVNTVAFTAQKQPLVVLAVLVLAALSLSGVLNTLQYQVIETLNQRFFVRAAQDAARRLVESDLAQTKPAAGAELMNRFFDVALVQKASATLLLDGLSVTLQGLVALVLLAFYHPALLAFDAVLVFLIGAILLILGRGGTSTSIKESKTKHALVATLQEVARGGAIFKSPAGVSFATERVDVLARDYVVARRKHFRVVRRQVVASYGLQALATAALLGLGGKLVIDGQLTLGQLVAAELAVTALLSSVAKLGKYLENYYDLAAAVDKVGQIVDLPAERTTGSLRRVHSGPAALHIENLICCHDNGSVGNEPLTIQVNPGELAAILGKDASGKTVLAETLYGVRRPSAGRIVLDGANLADLELTDLRRDVVLIGTEAPFNGTLKENLAFGEQELDPACVNEVLDMVGLTPDIDALPDGAMTRIGPEGVYLTGSQAARLALARGILAKPRLLVLDGTLDRIEPTAALDILGSLRSLTQDVSILVLTADPSIAVACDRVEPIGPRSVEQPS